MKKREKKKMIIEILQHVNCNEHNTITMTFISKKHKLMQYQTIKKGDGREKAIQNIHHHHHHQSLNRESHWGTTDDFATSFVNFSLFSTALWDLANSRPVHSLMLSSHLFLCLPCLLSPFTVPCKMDLAGSDERET